jgi:hypothetical protein
MGAKYEFTNATIFTADNCIKQVRLWIIRGMRYTLDIDITREMVD